MGTVYLFAPDACSRRISMLPEIEKGLSMAEAGQLTLTLAKLRDKKINCIYVGSSLCPTQDEEARIIVPGHQSKYYPDSKLYVLAEIIGTVLKYDEERYEGEDEDKPAGDPRIVKPKRHPPCIHCYLGWHATDDNLLQVLRNIKRDAMNDNLLIVTHSKVAAALCDLYQLVFDTSIVADFDDDGLMAIPFSKKAKVQEPVPVPAPEPVLALEPASV